MRPFGQSVRRPARAHAWVYAVNATLLICHEIDAAFWREWELFHLPGGVAGFVLLHIPLVAGVLWGLAALLLARPEGRWLSLVLAVAGLAGGVLHLGLLAAGDPAFRSPVSAALIGAFTLVSLVQLRFVVPAFRGPLPPGSA